MLLWALELHVYMVFMYIQKLLPVFSETDLFINMLNISRKMELNICTSTKLDRESITSSALKGEETGTKITILQVEMDVSLKK